MGMMSEFKEFAVKGNVVDMAVGVIIGGAFGKIVSSLVSDVIMPPVGLAVGGVNFTALVHAGGPAFALDKQGSAHGGGVEGPNSGFGVSGAAMLGVAVYNPTFAA